MKKTKILSVLSLFAFLLLFSVTLLSCAPKKTTAERIADGESVRIGVLQYMRHPSLDNCYSGIRAALDASGIRYDIDYQVGSDNAAYTDCTNYAQNMVASGCDLIIAIATPAAACAYAAAENTDIPVVFCAVSDPVGEKLTESLEKPGDLCTGTCDVLDLKAQLNLIRAFQPEVKSIGVIYTSSEGNSLTNLKNFREICENAGIEVIAAPVQSAADVPAAAESVASRADCINNFTDNNVVNNLAVVLDAAERYGIPVYGSEEEQVKNGCLASVSIDYVSLGRVTGEMAADILRGADAATMPVRKITDATPVVNTGVMKKYGYTLPVGYGDVRTVPSED